MLTRDLAVAVLAGAAVASGLVVSAEGHVLALSLVAGVALAIWMWPRVAHHKPKSRVGTPITVGLFGTMATGFAGIAIGAPNVALAAALVAVAMIARDRAQLGPDARTFSGTAHAIAATSIVPGTDRSCLVWVAHQGVARWSSTERIEVRNDARRVVVDPARAVIRRDAWVLPRGMSRAAAAQLDGADPEEPIHVRYVSEDDGVFLVGDPQREPDPRSESLRDPGQVDVYAGDVLVGVGSRRLAVRAIARRLALAGAVAALAGALVAARALGWA